MIPLASQDIIHILASLGLCSLDHKALNPDTGQPYPFLMYYGKEPAGEPDSITVYDVGGNGEQNAKFAIEDLIVQFRSRSVKYEDGFANISTVQQALDGASPWVVQRQIAEPKEITVLPRGATYNPLPGHLATRYIGFWVQSPPSHINRDEQNRAIFTMHVRLSREPMESGRGNKQTIGSHATT